MNPFRKSSKALTRFIPRADGPEDEHLRGNTFHGWKKDSSYIRDAPIPKIVLEFSVSIREISGAGSCLEPAIRIRRTDGGHGVPPQIRGRTLSEDWSPSDDGVRSAQNDAQDHHSRKKICRDRPQTHRTAVQTALLV